CVLSTMTSVLVFFFFSSRRRHTRFSRDWSSDVCSSDLGDEGPALIEASAAVPSEAEFERLSRQPARIRALSPLSAPRGRVLEALSSYSRIAMLLEEAPVRHYIDLYA